MCTYGYGYARLCTNFRLLQFFQIGNGTSWHRSPLAASPRMVSSLGKEVNCRATDRKRDTGAEGTDWHIGGLLPVWERVLGWPQEWV